MTSPNRDPRADEMVRQALTLADRRDRISQYTVYLAALLELLLLGLALTMMDLHDRTQRLVFIMSILTYTTLTLGLFALGARISAANVRLLRALETVAERVGR